MIYDIYNKIERDDTTCSCVIAENIEIKTKLNITFRIAFSGEVL